METIELLEKELEDVNQEINNLTLKVAANRKTAAILNKTITKIKEHDTIKDGNKRSVLPQNKVK